MIGIYHSKNIVQFYHPGSPTNIEELTIALDSDLLLPDAVQKAFEEASQEMGFKKQNDFRVAVDFPHSYSVAQNVPFGEKQLTQVLESYLEEEIPEDIDQFVFDYKVIQGSEAQCSVLGFWISREVLEAWCGLANELSLNYLDIQPAELALIQENADPCLRLCKDIHGRLRFSCLIEKNKLTQLSHGIIKSHLDQPQRVLQKIRFSGSDWSEVPCIETDPSSIELAESIAQSLKIPETKTLEIPEKICFFTHWASTTTSTKQSFNYRKGEYAQRGLHEKVFYPIFVLALVVILFLQAQIFHEIRRKKVAEQDNSMYRNGDKGVWKKLFADKKFPPDIDISLKQKVDEMNKVDLVADSKVSALQKLGHLFKYIEHSDDLNIYNISISPQSISIKAFADNPETYRSLEKGLGEGQEYFKTPSIIYDPRSSRLQVKTSYIEEKKAQ